VHDPTVVALAAGLLVSIVAGPAVASALQLLPQRRRTATAWLLIGGAAAIAIPGELWTEGRAGEGVFVFVLAVLPGIAAFLAFRTVLASALVSLLPLYFAIGGLTSDRTLHAPAVALDRVISLQPIWMLVYGSLYVFMLLPLLLVRQEQLVRRALRAYLTVLIVAYVGFLAYPTVTPRPADVPGGGFLAWCLRANYSLDSRYNCFPSLHVAHSFLSALTSYRVHRGVGLIALLWATLIGISALYTKQHYVVDVIAGALLGFIAYAVFLRNYPRDAIAESDRRRAPRRALRVIAIFGTMVACMWVFYETTRIGS
jgi:membrane-associated phospholipid phosphatase